MLQRYEHLYQGGVYIKEEVLPCASRAKHIQIYTTTISPLVPKPRFQQFTGFLPEHLWQCEWYYGIDDATVRRHV
jgi:hypothetical protein